MIQFEVPSFVIIIIFFLQKTAVIQVCIAEGEKARKKAMKIAVGLSGNKATFIYTILQILQHYKHYSLTY